MYWIKLCLHDKVTYISTFNSTRLGIVSSILVIWWIKEKSHECCDSLWATTWLITYSSSRKPLSHTRIGGRDYQHSLATPVTSYLFSSSTPSLICNQIAMRRRQRGVDILMPIKPLLRRFGVKVTFPDAWMPTLLKHTHTHTHICIIHNGTPTLCSVKNLLSVSTHQKVFRWHRAEHFLNANNAMCCAWLFNELGSRFHFTNCTNMQHWRTQAHAMELLGFSSPPRVFYNRIF